MTADFIPPLEAFRIILRAVYPENPRLPPRIKSKRYFESGQRKHGYLLASKWSPAEGTPPEHLRLPHEALRILADGIRAQKIALQGEREAEQRAAIPGVDCADGELDVFAATLQIDNAPPSTSPFRTRNRYDRVWCSRADVLAWISELVPNTAAPPCQPRRRTTRGEALDEAAAALFPKGVPAVSDLENQRLAAKIQDWLKSHKPAIKVNDKTILRKFRRAS